MANNYSNDPSIPGSVVLSSTDSGGVHTPNVALGANSGVDIGDVDVTSVAPPTVVVNGKKTVTTAGTQLALGSTTALLSGISIKAEADNTGIIYVGDSAVSSTTGYELAAGETVFMAIADIATVFIDTSVNGDGVTFVGS